MGEIGQIGLHHQPLHSVVNGLIIAHLEPIGIISTVAIHDRKLKSHKSLRNKREEVFSRHQDLPLARSFEP